MNEKDYEDKIKALEEEIKVMKERYRILAETTPSLLFEYRPAEDTMIFFYNFPDNKKRREIPHYKEFAKKSPLVHPDHVQVFMDVLMKASMSPEKGELEYLSKVSTGEFQWHRTYYSSIVDEEGKVISVLGRIHNIHESETAKREMQHKVETDTLTGLYNRGAISEKVSKWLKANPTGEAYMIMIDVDNFKSINDMYGHSLGDDVLKEVAKLLLSCFDEDSIFSRFGGDEFVGFVTDEPACRVQSRVDSFMERLLKEVHSLEETVHCSIGIAGRASKYDEFEDLFNRSDNAMYQAKKAGKNRYCVFKE
ncbi:MAG: diguanylate cyclase [Suilimivivens sp.]